MRHQSTQPFDVEVSCRRKTTATWRTLDWLSLKKCCPGCRCVFTCLVLIEGVLILHRTESQITRVHCPQHTDTRPPQITSVCGKLPTYLGYGYRFLFPFFLSASSLLVFLTSFPFSFFLTLFHFSCPLHLFPPHFLLPPSPLPPPSLSSIQPHPLQLPSTIPARWRDGSVCSNTPKPNTIRRHDGRLFHHRDVVAEGGKRRREICQSQPCPFEARRWLHDHTGTVAVESHTGRRFCLLLCQWNSTRSVFKGAIA